MLALLIPGDHSPRPEREWMRCCHQPGRRTSDHGVWVEIHGCRTDRSWRVEGGQAVTRDHGERRGGGNPAEPRRDPAREPAGRGRQRLAWVRPAGKMAVGLKFEPLGQVGRKGGVAGRAEPSQLDGGGGQFKLQREVGVDRQAPGAGGHQLDQLVGVEALQGPVEHEGEATVDRGVVGVVRVVGHEVIPSVRGAALAGRGGTLRRLRRRIRARRAWVLTVSEGKPGLAGDLVVGQAAVDRQEEDRPLVGAEVRQRSPRRGGLVAEFHLAAGVGRWGRQVVGERAPLRDSPELPPPVDQAAAGDHGDKGGLRGHRWVEPGGILPRGR